MKLMRHEEMFMLCLHFTLWKFLFQGEIVMWRFHVVFSKYVRNQSIYTWRTKWWQYLGSILSMQTKDLEKIITMICVEVSFMFFKNWCIHYFILVYNSEIAQNVTCTTTKKHEVGSKLQVSFPFFILFFNFFRVVPPLQEQQCRVMMNCSIVLSLCHDSRILP
jgi:hypothetical protein